MFNTITRILAAAVPQRGRHATQHPLRDTRNHSRSLARRRLTAALGLAALVGTSGCSLDGRGSESSKALEGGLICSESQWTPSNGQGVTFSDVTDHYLAFVSQGLLNLGIPFVPAAGEALEPEAPMTRSNFASLLLSDPGRSRLPNPHHQDRGLTAEEVRVAEMWADNTECDEDEVARVRLQGLYYSDLDGVSPEERVAICKVTAAGYYVGDLHIGSCADTATTAASTSESRFVRCFRPNAPITKAEMVAVSYKALFVPRELAAGRLDPSRGGVRCASATAQEGGLDATSANGQRLMVYQKGCEPDTEGFFNGMFSAEVKQAFFPQAECYENNELGGRIKDGVLKGAEEAISVKNPEYDGSVTGSRTPGQCYPHWATRAFHHAAIDGLYVLDDPCMIGSGGETAFPDQPATRGEALGTFFVMAQPTPGCFRSTGQNDPFEYWQFAYIEGTNEDGSAYCSPVVFDNFIVKEKVRFDDYEDGHKIRSCNMLRSRTPIYTEGATFPSKNICLVDENGTRLAPPPNPQGGTVSVSQQAPVDATSVTANPPASGTTQTSQEVDTGMFRQLVDNICLPKVTGASPTEAGARTCRAYLESCRNNDACEKRAAARVNCLNACSNAGDLTACSTACETSAPMEDAEEEARFNACKTVCIDNK